MDYNRYKPSWTDHFTVMWNDCMATGFSSLEALCSFFQESAWHHADHLGVGFQKLKNSDQAWVLARITLQIDHYPLWGDTISVKTWPTGVEKIFARRDFLFLDAGGHVLGSGASWWIIINPKTRQPQTSDVISDFNFDPRLEQFSLERLRLPKEMVQTGIHTVEYLETDQLGHVNNTRYAAWIQNSLGQEWNKWNIIDSYQIEFMAEAFPGDSILIATASPDGALTKLVNGKRKSDGKEIFRAKVGWNFKEDM